MNKGPKTITFTYEGKIYTLEYCRKTASLIEGRGFSIDEVGSKPNTMLPLLFWGAFQMHNRGTTTETTDEIFKRITKRDALFGKLIDMYAETVNTLTDEPEENEGNVDWDPSW